MIDPTPWATRVRSGRRATPLELTDEERAELERLLRTPTTEMRIARRAQGLLLMADAVPDVDIARLLGINDRSVRKWRERFEGTSVLDRLADAPRSGRPLSLFRTPTARVSSQKPVGPPPRSVSPSRIGR